MDWLYWEPEAKWTEVEWTGYTGKQRLNGLRLSGLVILGTRG